MKCSVTGGAVFIGSHLVGALSDKGYEGIGPPKWYDVNKEKILGFLKIKKEELKSPLHRNAMWLIGNSIGTSAMGFVFWVVVARLYLPSDVGLASALISAMLLLAMLGNLGFGIGFIRFLPEKGQKDSNEMINSCFIISGVFSFLLASIFLLGLNFWSPALVFIRENGIYIILFLLFTLIWVLTTLLNHLFISKRAVRYAFIKESGVFSGLKMLLPFLFAPFGAFGIFSAWGFSALIAFVLFLAIFLPKVYLGYTPNLIVKKHAINDILHFSFGNYVGETFRAVPRLVLPLMIINLLSATYTGYFYIAWMIASLLFMIPIAGSLSLFAEGSIEEYSLKKNVKKSIEFILLLLIPAIFIVYLFADKILLLVGTEYSKNATLLLQILALSSIPFAVNVVYVTKKRVEKRVQGVISVYGAMAFITIGLGYFLISKVGLVGVGISWLLAQLLILSFVCIEFLKIRNRS